MTDATIKCWKCNSDMTLSELSENDRDCLYCGAEIDLDEYLASALEELAFIRAQAQAAPEAEQVEVVAYMDENSCLWNGTTHPGRMTQLMTVAQHNRIMASAPQRDAELVELLWQVRKYVRIEDDDELLNRIDAKLATLSAKP